LWRFFLKKFNVATTIVTGFSLHPTLALPLLIIYICNSSKSKAVSTIQPFANSFVSPSFEVMNVVEIGMKMHSLYNFVEFL